MPETLESFSKWVSEFMDRPADIVEVTKPDGTKYLADRNKIIGKDQLPQGSIARRFLEIAEKRTAKGKSMRPKP